MTPLEFADHIAKVWQGNRAERMGESLRFTANDGAENVSTTALVQLRAFKTMKTFFLSTIAFTFAVTGAVNAADEDKDKDHKKSHDRPKVSQPAVAAKAHEAPPQQEPKHQNVKHTAKVPTHVSVKHEAPKRVVQGSQHVTSPHHPPVPTPKHDSAKHSQASRVPSTKHQPDAPSYTRPTTTNGARDHVNNHGPNRSTPAVTNPTLGNQSGSPRGNQHEGTQDRSNSGVGQRNQNVSRASTQVRNSQSVTVRNENLRNRDDDHNQWTEVRNRHDHEHHDRSWNNNYTRFARFGHGYYFLDNGYWYPAYGYDSTYSTYVTREPIYAYNDLDPSDVIGRVQSELQRLGYYDYRVDGLLGPITRGALGAYQRDSGLEVTDAIDRATLRSLGLG